MDDNVMEVHIWSDDRGKSGGDKISQGEQNFDIEEEGRETKWETHSYKWWRLMYLVKEGTHNRELLIKLCYVIGND